MKKRSHRACVYKLQYQLVFVTKYRNKCLNKKLLVFLESEFRRLLENAGCALLDFNGEQDHIHALIELHPSIEPAKLINSIKSVSSRMATKYFSTHLKKYYWEKPSLWSRSYCLLSVGGAPLSVLKDYIKDQDRPNS
jgi:putative transposase